MTFDYYSNEASPDFRSFRCAYTKITTDEQWTKANVSRTVYLIRGAVTVAARVHAVRRGNAISLKYRRARELEMKVV